MKIKELFNSKKKIVGLLLICVAVVIASISAATTIGVNNARKSSLKEYDELMASDASESVFSSVEDEMLPAYDVNDSDIERMRQEVLRISDEGGTPEEKAEKLLEYSRENNLPAAVSQTETVEMPVNYAVNNGSKTSASSKSNTKKTNASKTTASKTNTKTGASNTSKTSTSNKKNTKNASKNSSAKKAATKKATPTKLIPDGTVLGVINIPSIACRETIKEGTTNAVLKSAVGHMDDTSYPGFPGNCVIMGHRNYTYGLFFNRLNEVKIGDVLSVESNGITRLYMVYASYVVEPDDFSESVQSGLNEVTLITCTPIYVATHRLIVKAVLIG